MRSVRKKHLFSLLAGVSILVFAAVVHDYVSARVRVTDANDALSKSNANLSAGLESYAKGCAEALNWKSRDPVSDFESALEHFDAIDAQESQSDYEAAQLHIALIHAFFRRVKQKQAYSVIARDILTDLYRASKSVRVKDQCILLLEQIDELDRYYFKSIVDMDGQMEEMIRDMSAFMAGGDRK